jgi:Cu-Zn family superoxide dismutase
MKDISTIAVFMPTPAISTYKISGITTFIPKSSKRMLIKATISGLKPNHLHGFHIHEYGDLSQGCTSLCSHFNPYKKTHGDYKGKNRHVGDLGNLKSNKKGIAKLCILVSNMTNSGKNSILGRSLVIHEDEDDLGLGDFPDSKTTGHSGKRIACAIIGRKTYEKE